MEKIILSLKNIYKILMTNDFPIYSESVIGEKERKGQTVIRFWQNILVPEFKSLPSGKMIWRYTEKRNRYTSQLCNRSLSPSVIKKYAKELAAQLSEATLLNQIDRFAQFLSGRLYKHEVLIRRTQELIRLCQTEDPYTTDKIANLLLHSAESVGNAGQDARFPLFQAGYLLSLMTLYAAAGEAMGDPVLEALQCDAYSLGTLWEKQRLQRTEIAEETIFWTNHAGTLQDNVLPYDHFFGREEAVYDLLESIGNRQKYLISGIGGIGKTELLRQIIRRCADGHLVDTLAIVPYEGSLLASFARAFPGFQEKEPQESFHSILYQFGERAKRGEHVLLLIDDLHGEVEKDTELARLHDLPCGILVTSRLDALDGFETYRLTDPSVTACTLIFRDHYGQSLPQQDRSLLKELLQKEIICHPLTLRMMARAAKNRGWSITQLQSRLAEAGCSLSWLEGDRVVQISDVYHQLYSFSRIPENCRQLVELFTLLPYDVYAPDFLGEVFPETTGDTDNRTAALRQLAAEGWLEESESGYSMHPLIAQCLRRKTVTEEILHPYLPGIYRCLPSAEALAGEWDDSFNCASYRTLNRILLSFARFLTGNSSPELFCHFCISCCSVVLTRREWDSWLTILDHLYARCVNPDDELSMLYGIAIACADHPNEELFLLLYQKQKEQKTVSDSLFYDFCCYTGASLRRVNPDMAKRLLMEVLEQDTPANLKAAAYYHLSILHAEMEDSTALLEWGERGLAFVKAHPECGTSITLHNMIAPCNVYLAYGRMEEAEELLHQIGALSEGNTLPSLKFEYTFLCGICAMNKGNLEEALSQYEKSREILLEYYGKNINYYSSVSMQIATTLLYMKRYEDAAAQNEEILAYARESGNAFLAVKVSNNLAVCRLEMGDAQKALSLLTASLEKAREMDALILGEVLRNLARAHRMLGETEQEIPCLKESLPLLESVYGPEHQRCTAMRERLAALQT